MKVCKFDAIHIVDGKAVVDVEKCVNCGACMLVCSARIDPRMLSRYAEFNKYGMSRKENFHLCVDCGLCEEKCPQHLQIRQLLKKVEGVLESL